MPRRILEVQATELQPSGHQVDLVARVDANESFRGLREEYHSWLWCLVAYSDIDFPEYNFLLRELMCQFRLFQSPGHLAALGAQALPGHPAFQPSMTPTEAIGPALEVATLDHVALLACGFRLEYERLNLLAANDYLLAARVALQRVVQRLGLPEPIAGELIRIVELRALRRDWGAGGTASDVPRRIRSRYKQQQSELLDNLLGSDPRRDPVESGPSYPIVILTPALEQFLEDEANRRIAHVWGNAP
jgi:hypothetical protein